ncbi:MAG: signal recognition particle protein [Candidatus Cloacimonetes bacterium]|nr:signal recognition particle protein [Candidatus Cloacimonadota bacterium]
MFNELTDKLDGIFKKLKGKGKLTEDNIKESLREVRRALLEADVNFKIVKNFINEIQERAIGQEVMKSLEPGHQVIKIVREQLVNLMGETNIRINLPTNRKNKIMLVGLQGSGKTTACAKLASFFRKKGNKPLLVACDVYRPAAIHQLETLGKQLNLPVVSKYQEKDVLKIADQALRQADTEFHDLLIFDTAGRLHIDEIMMKEVNNLKNLVKPDYIFFVADAMTGQDAVNVAKEFHNVLNFDAIILTKMDGDARGGAALSIKAITGKPVAYIGTGEKINDLEEFHADRMASRILGMGDILSLIEKAEESFDKQKAEEMAKRMRKNQFNFMDFLDQIQQIKKMGPLDQLMGMIPGMNNKALKDVTFEDKELKHIEAIIFSMTHHERNNPSLLNGSRRKRIADGSGTSIQEVNRFLKQFEQMKKMMKNFSGKKMPKGMSLPF